MQDLDNAIQAFRQAVAEYEWRQKLGLIIAIIGAVTGFPIPPNQPDPETVPSKPNDWVDDVEEASNGFEWPGDN